MRIGCTGGPREWPVAASLGYDYAEGNFSWFASLDDAAFDDARRTLAGTGLKCETFNGFFPGNLLLYQATDEYIKDYCARAFERAALLGGEIAVLGSGGARQLRDGITHEEAEKRFAEILTIAGDASQVVGMKTVIEPLRRAECNFINTLEESVAMVRRVGHPAVGTLLDFFHFYANGESLDTVPAAAPYLWHTHLARPNPDRNVPSAEDMPVLRQYADALRGIGYHARISLECSWSPDYKTAITAAFPIMDVFRSV